MSSRPPHRRDSLLVALLLAASSSACTPADPPVPQAARHHNVVLVTLDTVRADYLSSYGYPLETTPHLDALAQSGARFELCVSTSGLTPVSHASILTGLNQDRHGLRVMDAGTGYTLEDSVPTLASQLRAAGWTTGAFLSAFPVSERFGLDQGFDVFRNGLGGAVVEMTELDDGNTKWDGKQYQRRSDETVDELLAWLDGVDEPFFVWIHLWDPHDGNTMPPAEFADRFGLVSNTPTDKHDQVKLTYATELAYVDAQFGRLVEGLEQLELVDDTVFAVTADHGEGLFEHDWHHHKILYQEQLHVPLIVKLPEGPQGAVVHPLVRTVDVAPTVLDVLGLPTGDVDGRSLLPLLRGEDDAPRLAYADALNEFDRNARLQESRPQDLLLYSMMDQRWKLIFRPRAPDTSELFDLASDPDEANNLYAPDHPEALRLLRELRARGPLRLEGFGRSRATREVSDALKGLGYVGDDPDEPAGEDPGEADSGSGEPDGK